jgi:magnesium-transporting ATPase (P-type)
MLNKNTLRILLLIFISLLLIVIAWETGYMAINQWTNSLTFGQKLETVVQFICCVLSVVVVFTVWLKIPSARYIQYVWGLSLVSMSVISALVWGPPMFLPVVVFGLISGVITFGVLYVIRKYGIG